MKWLSTAREDTEALPTKMCIRDRVNVVPAAASFSVDCRYKSMEEGQRIRREILELPISVPGASREVEIVEGKLPMEETQGNMELFAAAKECGRKLGLSFSHQFVGGGSDGNAVSAMGIPTLDEMCIRDRYRPG